MKQLSDSNTWNVQIVAAEGICSWIDDKGGPANLTFPDVFEIVDAYVFNTPPTGHTFIPTITQVMGIFDYKLGFTESGNTNTGCDY